MDSRRIQDLRWRPYLDRLPFDHMMPQELPLWRRFIRLQDDRFTEIVYDVHVGAGATITFTKDPVVVAWAKHLTQLRIDVLGRRSSQLTVVEVRRFPGLASFGQVLGYATLFRRDFHYTGVLRKLLVCEFITDDLRWLARRARVEVVVVPLEV